MSKGRGRRPNAHYNDVGRLRHTVPVSASPVLATLSLSVQSIQMRKKRCGLSWWRRKRDGQYWWIMRRERERRKSEKFMFSTNWQNKHLEKNEKGGRTMEGHANDGWRHGKRGFIRGWWSQLITSDKEVKNEELFDRSSDSDESRLQKRTFQITPGQFLVKKFEMNGNRSESFRALTQNWKPKKKTNKSFLVLSSPLVSGFVEIRSFWRMIQTIPRGTKRVLMHNDFGKKHIQEYLFRSFFFLFFFHSAKVSTWKVRKMGGKHTWTVVFWAEKVFIFDWLIILVWPDSVESSLIDNIKK